MKELNSGHQFVFCLKIGPGLILVIDVKAYISAITCTFRTNRGTSICALRLRIFEDFSEGGVQKHELERSPGPANKTRVNIEFYGHIDKILRQTI